MKIIPVNRKSNSDQIYILLIQKFTIRITKRGVCCKKELLKINTKNIFMNFEITSHLIKSYLKAPIFSF